MPTVRFADNIQRHVECPTRVVEGARVRDVLEAYFATNMRQLRARRPGKGKTFERLARGLPQEHAYDLGYRHALDIDDTARYWPSARRRDRCE
jgi:hypothetical protein